MTKVSKNSLNRHII